MTHIKIYVPTQDINKIYDIARQLTNIFGGATIIPNCKGYWKGLPTEKLKDQYEVDNITIIESYTEILSRHWILNIQLLCDTLKSTLKQQSLMYTIDNKAYFV